MHSLKRRLPKSSVLRFLISPRLVHRLKLNTLLRLAFILLLGSAGLTACANLQQEQMTHKQENDVTVSFAERLQIKAEQGDVLGQAGLGMMYAEGRGVPQDDTEAVQWFRKAAEQGHSLGQNNLGWMYREGRGVPRDDQLAVQWFRKAAEQGYAAGQHNLGWMYREGRGVPKNYVYAYMWMDIGFEGAGDKGLVGAIFEKEMTPSQIQKAKELARACERKQYKDCEV